MLKTSVKRRRLSSKMNIALLRYGIIEHYDATTSNMNAQDDAVFVLNRATVARLRPPYFKWVF